MLCPVALWTSMEMTAVDLAAKNNESDLSNKLSGGEKNLTAGKKKRKRKRKAKEASESQDISRQKLAEDNKKEDKEIKRLEKLLRLDKKKKVPSQFSHEGLDCILGIYVHDKNLHVTLSFFSSFKKANQNRRKTLDMGQLSCSEDEQEELVTSGNDDVVDDDDDDDDDGDDDDDDDGDDDDGGDSGHGGDYNEADSDEEEEDNFKDNDDDEDAMNNIYNDVDDDGNEDNTQNITCHKYVPPHLRRQPSSEAQREHLNRIRRQVKGLLNRLSEGNMSLISSEIENLFTHNSRNDMNKILSELILGSCVSISLMPDKLLMEHVMLLAILTSHIGTEVGAFFVERLAEMFDNMHNSEKDSYGKGKECVNIVALFAHLYNFKVIDCCLIYDIIRRLVDTFSVQDIELLLFVLKSNGAEIRRDDPASLKDIILQIQAKAASSAHLTSNSRVRFMLEIISNLRNNNLRKIPGYDPSRLEHLRKVLRSLVRDSSQAASNQLKISLEDLLKPETKGRWWIAGSSLSRRNGREFIVASSAQMENTKLLELARKQRMNTDVRKNVFLVMMTSEDYIDAFEKLLRLNLKDAQTREVIHVLIDCCVQERTYNPYYAYLGQKFCEYNRSYQVTFQYSFWDKLKVVGDLASHSVDNLSCLMSHLIATRALSLAILKVVNFVELDKPSVRLFTSLFRHLLLDYSTDITRNVFERISTVQGLSTLRQSLRIFIKHFVGKGKISKTSKTDKHTELKERLQLVDSILGASDRIKL
ncbi:unnamed protein product [Porites evermanni]|uniref:MI domain-containing protein n=1 Tax=Porites evermanni TaxID=104178 RepID=A0ABN8LFG4_9CNID|nr:unnamed protein product [Porites evermanni]